MNDAKNRIITLGTTEDAVVNPWDTAPETEAEAMHEIKVRTELLRRMNDLRESRKWIRFVDLAQMTLAPAVVYEGTLGKVDGRDHGMWFFSLQGYLGGQKTGAVLLEGSAMSVSAPSYHDAWKLAESGLHDTWRFARERYAEAVVVDAAEKERARLEAEGLTPMQEIAKNPGLSIEGDFTPTRH